MSTIFPFMSILIWIVMIIFWIAVELRQVRRWLRVVAVVLLILVFPLGVLELSFGYGMLRSKAKMMQEQNVDTIISAIEHDRLDDLVSVLEAYREDIWGCPTLYRVIFEMNLQLAENDLWPEIEEEE